MEDEVVNPNWLPRTIQGAGSLSPSIFFLPSSGLVDEGASPEEGATARTFGAAFVPVLGRSDWTSDQFFTTDGPVFSCPNGIVNLMMYQSTVTVPPVGGPQSST